MKSKFNYQQDSEIQKLYLSGLTAIQIANSFGVYKQSVLYSLKRTGTSVRKKWKRASGKDNGHWNGGVRYIKGYKHILIPNSHLARNDGYVPEHRLVMEKKLGRPLLKTEVVNHINGNIKNNQENNLEIFENNGKHIIKHCVNFARDNKGKFIKKNY